MFTWNKKKAKEASPLGEMLADRVDALDSQAIAGLKALDSATVARLNKLANLDPLLNIAADKEIKIDKSTGAVSVGDKA